MLERAYSGWDVTCDYCSVEFLEVDSATHYWPDFQSALKTTGWRSINEQGEWLHRCPECEGGD